MDVNCNGRSGKDFDITSQRVAASNPVVKDAFVEALGM